MRGSSAAWLAAMESVSSWAPQAHAQPPPPIAHAPKPIGVMCRSEFPSLLVFISETPRKERAKSHLLGRLWDWLNDGPLGQVVSRVDRDRLAGVEPNGHFNFG